MVINLGISYRAGQIGGPAGKLSGAPPMRVKALIQNTMLVNSGFPHAKEFLLKLSVVGAGALKNFPQPRSRPKLKKKNICLKGSQVNNLPGSFTCFGRPWFRVMRRISNLALQKTATNGDCKLHTDKLCTRDLNPALRFTFRKWQYSFFNNRIAQGKLLKWVNYSEDSTP